jgi:hypothetical protein
MPVLAGEFPGPWWRVQIGEFSGREVDARVAAWTLLAANLRSGTVILDGLDEQETELVGNYAEWLGQRLPDQECSLYDWAVEDEVLRSPPES